MGTKPEETVADYLSQSTTEIQPSCCHAGGGAGSGETGPGEYCLSGHLRHQPRTQKTVVKCGQLIYPI